MDKPNVLDRLPGAGISACEPLAVLPGKSVLFGLHFSYLYGYFSSEWSMMLVFHLRERYMFFFSCF